MEKKKPFVSVIIVTYNYADTLPKALMACARQTFRDFELVLVDNYSSDNTSDVAKVIDAFCQTHTAMDIHVVHVAEYHDLMHGRNAGLANSRGKYLLYNDADDWMDDNCLALLADKAKETDADRIIGSFRDITPDNKITKIHHVIPDSSRWYYNMIQAEFFKRSIFAEHNITFGNLLWDDVEITSKFNVKCNKIAYVDTCCYNYLIHPSASHSTNLHETMWEDNRSLSSILSCWRSAYDSIGDNTNKVQAEYQIAKIYYYYIYFILKNAPLKVKWDSYKKLRLIMIKSFPNYKNNKNITLLRKNGVEFTGRSIVWVAVICEKLHLMKLVLLIYHLLNKVVRFKF